MNQTFFPSTFHRAKLVWSFSLTALMILFGPQRVHSQGAKKSGPAPSAPGQKSASNQGYLSLAAPSGLRFAAPPKPPVAYLPPLPITYDPQPVFSSEFAPPTTDLATPKPPPPAPLPPSVVSPSLTSLASNFGTNRSSGQIPTAPVEMGSVSPQMLVRFFPGGKLGEVELLLTNAMSFRVPVREEKPSSSASYEVK